MLKIWGRANSVNVQKAIWATAETGVAFERVDAGMVFGKNNEDWYLELNPNGKIPLLQHDGFSFGTATLLSVIFVRLFRWASFVLKKSNYVFWRNSIWTGPFQNWGPPCILYFGDWYGHLLKKETRGQSNQESRPASGFSRCSTSTFSTRVLFAVRISPWGTFLRERWLIDGSIWKSTVPCSRHYRNGMRNCWNVRPTESTWSCH